jgi:hypothetical protein
MELDAEFQTILERYQITNEFNDYLLKLNYTPETPEIYVTFRDMFLGVLEKYLNSNREFGSLCKQKKKGIEFILSYVFNVLELRQRPYFDDIKDQEDQEEYYKDVNGNLNYDSLHNLLFSTFKHANRRIGLWALIDRQPNGTLQCAYSGKIVENANCIRLCKADEEHLVPQSWHSGSR